MSTYTSILAGSPANMGFFTLVLYWSRYLDSAQTSFESFNPLNLSCRYGFWVSGGNFMGLKWTMGFIRPKAHRG